MLRTALYAAAATLAATGFGTYFAASVYAIASDEISTGAFASLTASFTALGGLTGAATAFLSDSVVQTVLQCRRNRRTSPDNR